MRRIILYIFAVIAAAMPFLKAAVYGSAWGEFFIGIAVGALIAFLLCTIANLIGRVEKLEEKYKDES